jgi:probable rRNA maturation factor
VRRIRKGKLIPREDGKRIEEFVGVANTGTRSVSVARILAPPGWRGPPQTPGFDEVVMVQRGTLTLAQGRRKERIEEGEVGFVPKGTTVVYRNDGAGACDYYSVCVPAFRPGLAHREEAPAAKEPSRVLVQSSHRMGKKLERRVLADARRFLTALDVHGAELSVALMGDAAIRRLNKTWRQKDKATDVLSFPAGELPRGVPGPRPLGDVIISLDTAARVAKEDGRPIEDEVSRYLAHGILHLLGYDHERSAREARKMAALEEKLLGGEGLIPRSGRARPL